MSETTDRRQFVRFEMIKVKFTGGHPQVDGIGKEPQVHEAEVEGYWDEMTGKSWMFSDGNPACIMYALRTAMSPEVPIDDDVIYVKIGGLGHLVHTSEVQG